MRTRWRTLPRLLGISPGDHRRGRDLSWQMEGAVAAGLQLLVIREAHLEERALVDLLRRLAPLLGEGLILHASNAHAAELAIRCGTGLHLPSYIDASPLRSKIQGWLGQSCHSPMELAAARGSGCDYVTLSPVYRPISKPSKTPSTLGPEGLAQLCLYTDLPVMALGGITAERVSACTQAGAYGVASMGGLFPPESTPEDTADRTRALYSALAKETPVLQQSPRG